MKPKTNIAQRRAAIEEMKNNVDKYEVCGCSIEAGKVQIVCSECSELGQTVACPFADADVCDYCSNAVYECASCLREIAPDVGCFFLKATATAFISTIGCPALLCYACYESCCKKDKIPLQ